jgi:Ca2+-binding RTX toxin-like protein
MLYSLSGENQKAMAAANQEENDKISEFYNNTWLPIFGSNSNYYKNNEGSSVDWVTQVAKGDSNISPDVMMNAIKSSYTWSIGNAYNSDFGMRSAYKSMDAEVLIEGLFDGSITYNEAFTGQLTFGTPMSWSRQMYDQLSAILDLTEANTKLTGQETYQNNIVDNALSYLRVAVGNTAAQAQLLEANKDNYGTVFTGGLPSGSFPDYIPYPGVFGQTSLNVQDIIKGTNTAGTDFSIYIDTSSGDSVKIGKDSSSAASVSASADYKSWFYRAKASASASTYTDTTFKSADANSDATSGTISFKNSYYQTWSPPQDGQNSWFMLDAIKSAFTNGVSAGKLPYTQSPSFDGGWGFVDSIKAKSYLEDGFQYIKSLAYSAEPTTTVSVSSASDNSTFYNSDTFSNSAFSGSAGIGYGSWFGGGNASASASGSTSSSSKTTTSTYNSAASAYEVSNSGIGSTNNSPALAYGYGALQLGVSVNTPVAPISSAKTNSLSGASFKRRGSEKYSLPAADFVISRNSKKGYYSSDSSDNGQHIVFPGKGRDIYLGDRGKDIVSGGIGKDELYGHGGNDHLVGGGASDFLVGGHGKNILEGGRGADYFELDAAAAKSNKRYKHIVVDFKPNKDVLWLVNNAEMSELSHEGNWVTYGGEKTIKLMGGLAAADIATAINTAESAMGF